ncbi:MAG TPA: hypothetical protein VL098_09510 [Flavipsychrobacter sp.]|nr:hypothetical protein [Flavipsychrobacter sp.]
MKKYIGELISLKLNNRLEPVYGIVIEYNEEWTLMKHNPVDYVVDGFLIINNKKVKGYKKDSEEKFKQKVIKLKTAKLGNINTKIHLNNDENVFQTINSKYKLVQFELKSENILYVGSIISIEDKCIYIRSLSPTAKWNKEHKKIRISDIRLIQFDNDYLNSLELLLV